MSHIHYVGDDDDMDIFQECGQQDKLPEDGEENEQDELADILHNDEHVGEFDDAPDEDKDKDEDGCDSNVPLAKCCCTSDHVNPDPQSEYLKATWIQEHIVATLECVNAPCACKIDPTYFPTKQCYS